MLGPSCSGDKGERTRRVITTAVRQLLGYSQFRKNEIQYATNKDATESIRDEFLWLQPHLKYAKETLEITSTNLGLNRESQCVVS